MQRERERERERERDAPTHARTRITHITHACDESVGGQVARDSVCS